MFNLIVLQVYIVVGAVVAAIPAPTDVANKLAGWEKVVIAGGLLVCLFYLIKGITQAAGSGTKRGEGVITAIIASIGIVLIGAGGAALAGAVGFS